MFLVIVIKKNMKNSKKTIHQIQAGRYSTSWHSDETTKWRPFPGCCAIARLWWTKRQLAKNRVLVKTAGRLGLCYLSGRQLWTTQHIKYLHWYGPTEYNGHYSCSRCIRCQRLSFQTSFCKPKPNCIIGMVAWRCYSSYRTYQTNQASK